MAVREPLTSADTDARPGGRSPPGGATSAAPGPPPDLRHVFEQHAPYVLRALRYLGVPDADVRDLAQEVFLVVHRKIDGFEHRSAITTWLYGICIRVAARHRRRAHVRLEIPGALADLTEEPAHDGLVGRAEARASLNALLELLDDDKRAVLVLYEIEGLNMREVAQAVGCPMQTAYSRLYAARRIVVEAARRVETGARCFVRERTG